MPLKVRPSTISAAKKYLVNHRHHKSLTGALFAVAAEKDGELVGVGVVGRPKARALDDGMTAEITRVCTDGTMNACSTIYGALVRACRALGYAKVYTYTLDSELGSSLKASGAMLDGITKGGSWNCDSRPRVDSHPTVPKKRWVWVL